MVMVWQRVDVCVGAGRCLQEGSAAATICQTTASTAVSQQSAALASFASRFQEDVSKDQVSPHPPQAWHSMFLCCCTTDCLC